MSQACEDQIAQRVLAAAADGIISVDADGRISFANPAAARLIGCKDATELEGQPLPVYLQFVVGEGLCFREDGSSFPIECEIAELEPEGTVVTFRDVTARRAKERAREEAIAVVSHELRTPMTSIRSALGLLAGGAIGELPYTARRMIEIGVGNADRLIRLVSDLLDLERVEAGHNTMRLARSEVGWLMHEAADGVQALADEAGVTLKVASIDAQVNADPDRMLQVFTNLLANAIKFSPESGGTVWLEAEDSVVEIVFRVRDEGRGIPADKLEHIFERFAQVDERDAREKGGAGLGLAISRSIVHQHGGQIWAESTLGVGTTVCVALPLLARDSATWLAPLGSDEEAAA